MNKQIPLYPVVFVLWYLVALYVGNWGEAQPEDVVRSLAIAVIGTGIIWAVLAAWFRDWTVGAFFSWVTVIFCLSYRFQYEIVFEWFPQITHLWASLIPFALFGVVWYFISWFPAPTFQVTIILNLVVGILLALSLGQGAAQYWQMKGLADEEGLSAALDEGSNGPGKQVNVDDLPDIYYIILDGYGRADVLQEMYGFNNGEFIEALRQRGFFVAENSKANYPQTVLSLASSLNLHYLTHLQQTYGPRNQIREPLLKEITENRLMSFLQTQGYQTVAFSSGIAFTELRNAERYIVIPGAYNEWELLFLSQTPFPFLMQNLFGYSLFDIHKHRLKYMIEELPRVTVSERPSFVFAHFVTPHPPFILGDQAPFQGKENLFSFRDGSHYRHYYKKSSKQYQARYLKQLQALNARIISMLDEILSNASRPTVIVLQGDHGPGAYVDWEDRAKTNLRERMSILNAIYVPSGKHLALYDDMTPVNTFRMILQQYFQLSLPLLKDEAFFSLMQYPFDFSLVSDLS